MSTLTISRDGTLSFVWDDKLAGLKALGRATIKRASYVEPNEDGRWVADLTPCGGPVFDPVETRAEAIALELAWLEAEFDAGRVPVIQ